MNVFNNVSVVATRYHLTWTSPYKKMYNGVDKAPEKSMLNLFRGLQAHVLKKTTEAIYKPTGLYVLYPILITNFAPHMASTLFALSMSGAEVMISNPFDSLRF